MSLGKLFEYVLWSPPGEHFLVVGHMILACLLFVPVSWMKTKKFLWQILWTGLLSFYIRLFLICRSWEAKNCIFFLLLHSLVLDMNYIPSIKFIPERPGGWKWSRSYPTCFQWLSCKQAHRDQFFTSHVLEFILETLRYQGTTLHCQVASSVNVKMQSSGGSDGSSISISTFLVWLSDLCSDSKYELIPSMVNYHVVLGVLFGGTA